MKAKEYANGIIFAAELSNEQFNKVVYDTINELFKEVVQLVKSRNCQCDAAFIAVFDEIDNKWLSICRIVNENFGNVILKSTGFRELAFTIADKVGMWQMRFIWHPKKIKGE